MPDIVLSILQPLFHQSPHHTIILIFRCGNVSFSLILFTLASSALWGHHHHQHPPPTTAPTPPRLIYLTNLNSQSANSSLLFLVPGIHSLFILSLSIFHQIFLFFSWVTHNLPGKSYYAQNSILVTPLLLYSTHFTHLQVAPYPIPNRIPNLLVFFSNS